jgi:trans-aconitate methyltransferase
VKDNVERKDHWESVYRQKAVEETSWHQPSPKMSLIMIGRTAVSVKTPIIDIGGGASLLADHLLGLGYRDVTVLDISRAALEQAQSRLGDRSKQLNWIEADVTRFKPARQYGLWHDRAAFHFLTETGDRQKYARVLEKALEPGGQAIIATFSPQGPKKCSGLDIVRYDAQKIEKTLGPAFRLLEQQEDLHTTPAGREQRFNYFRILKI